MTGQGPEIRESNGFATSGREAEGSSAGCPGTDPMPIDVFDADGAYRGTLPEGTEFPALLMVDGRVGFVREDEMDVGRLVVGEATGTGDRP